MKENLCRICGQCFCCKKCRFKHEESKHSVHPECDICVYGKFILNNLSNSLMEHIKELHLPVHCLRCKKEFATTTDLMCHDKCLVKIERKETLADKLNSASEINYETPPTTVNMYKSILISGKSNYNHAGDVTTSTPMMQNNNDRDMMLDNIQEVITPVDAIENHDNVKNLNSHIKIGVTPSITEQSKGAEGAFKRRVTFIETPTEYSTNKKLQSTYGQSFKTPGKQLSSVNNDYHKNLSDDQIISGRRTPSCKSNASSCNSQNTTYATASESKHVEILPSPKEEDEYLITNCTDPVEEDEDLTWRSALMDPDSSILSTSENHELQFKDVPEPSKFFADLLTADIQPKNETELKPNVAIADGYLLKKEGIWSSMTNLLKTAYRGFSSTENIADSKEILKRPRCDSDSIINSPIRKKIKLSGIEGRKPIHELKPSFIRYRRKVLRLDKSTQTD